MIKEFCTSTVEGVEYKIKIIHSKNTEGLIINGVDMEYPLEDAVIWIDKATARRIADYILKEVTP